MESDTPRTDAENYIYDIGLSRWVSIEFARQLERELAAAIKQRDEAQRDAQRYRWLKSEGCLWITIYRYPGGGQCFDGKGNEELDYRIDAQIARDKQGGGA